MDAPNHHSINGILQMQDFASHVNLDLLRSPNATALVTFAMDRTHGGRKQDLVSINDGTHLRRQISGQLVDYASGKCFPQCFISKFAI
jgi:hypothetical protein